ncbi:MAG: IS1380 family transposase [Candidatus Aminicenantales bacterium]
MITQGILPFKIEVTDELITPRSGLALFSEVVRTLKVEQKVGSYFPRPGSNRGYEAWAYIEPLLLMLEGGGRHVEDVREIRDDAALRALIGLEEMPSTSTFGDWLARTGEKGGVEAMRKVGQETAKTILKRLATPNYTLDVDATVIEAEKREAEWTYKKVKGYQPMLGFLAEVGVCLREEFREGNVPAQSGVLEFLKDCIQLCPKIQRLRSDSAAYQAEVINWCEENGIGFTITADQDAGVKGVIKTVQDWKPLLDGEGKKTDREVGTAIHIMARTKEPFRLVIQRWRDPQLSLYEPAGFCTYVIATSRDDLTPEEVVCFHNQRGQAENFIKELKLGFGMEQMTSGDFWANALWFSIGVLAYNLTQAQKLLFMDPEWKPKTVATLRWQLIEIAGRVIRHGRRLILRLATTREKYRLMLQMRRRVAGFT